MSLLSDTGKNTLLGVILVVISVVFLLSGIDLLEVTFFSENLDIVIAFILLAIGLVYIFSESEKKEKNGD